MMIWLLTAMYFWAGLTAAIALWQMEQIGESLNGLFERAGECSPRITTHLKGRAGVWLAVILIWPAIAPIWIVMWRRHNTNVTGLAPGKDDK